MHGVEQKARMSVIEEREVGVSRLNTAPAAGAELAIIVPTYKEGENVRELVRRLDGCLRGRSWEVIFVDDDSPDGTADVVREIAQRDRRVRCLQRIGRRGLSSACIEGMLATSAQYLAVMDGDLQHDETLLPDMLDTLKGHSLDIVVGSRYVGGGGLGEWAKSRANISRFAIKLSRLALKADLEDPMSGFFMLRRQVLEDSVRELSGIGFKILLDLFASSPRPLRFKELPYEFRTRQAGESKLDIQVAWEYLLLLADKTVGQILPVRFLSFSIVGALGTAVHFLILTTLYLYMSVRFVESQAAATVIAMTFNYAINNELTYRDIRLRGWNWLKGWVSFSSACSVGAFANVGIASYLLSDTDTRWALAAISGIIVGAVWNYAVTMVYTWRKPKESG